MGREGNLIIGIICVGVLVFCYVSRTEKIGDPGSTTRSNIKQLAVALEIYLSDWNDRLPPAETTARAQKVLFPYSRMKGIWNATFSHGPISFNTSLAGKEALSFERPEKVVTFFSEPGFKDDLRWVAFLDASTRGVTEDEWADLQLRPSERTVAPPNPKKSHPPSGRSEQ